MDYAIVVGLQIASGVATLVLVSLGLAVVFGMMRVINLAHGEFLMLGGYAAVLAHGHGMNIWLSILVVPPVVVGMVGAVVERLLIRGLYGRMIDTISHSKFWKTSAVFVVEDDTQDGADHVDGLGEHPAPDVDRISRQGEPMAPVARMTASAWISSTAAPRCTCTPRQRPRSKINDSTSSPASTVASRASWSGSRSS